MKLLTGVIASAVIACLVSALFLLPTGSAAESTQLQTGPIPGPPVPIEESDLPAKFVVTAAHLRVIQRGDPARALRVLMVRGLLDGRAAGDPIAMRYRAGGRQIAIRSTVRDGGQIVVNRILRGPQRLARVGGLAIRYPGNDTLRPAVTRLRAAFRPVGLRIAAAEVEPRNNLDVSGQVRPRAAGSVIVQIEYNRSNGNPAMIVDSAEVSERGTWRLRRSVPTAAVVNGSRVSATHPGRGLLFGQRMGRDVGPAG